MFEGGFQLVWPLLRLAPDQGRHHLLVVRCLFLHLVALLYPLVVRLRVLLHFLMVPHLPRHCCDLWLGRGLFVWLWPWP